MKVLGIDEAGRGPVIGPLVVAGVLIEAQDQERLLSLGVRDSKALSRPRRAELAQEIIQIAQVQTISIPAERLEENLNEIELQAMASLIRELRPDEVYFDVPAPPRGVTRFCQRLRELVGPQPELFGENHADERWPVVAAASIVAKVERDKAILGLHERYGDFGWGYPSERKVREFLRRWHREHGDLPPCVRRKWRTVQRLLEPPRAEDRQGEPEAENGGEAEAEEAEERQPPELRPHLELHHQR